MIKVLDNVYDLVTLNMEQRFSERVALRFYDKETDEVTVVHYKDYARDIRRAVSYFQSTIPDIKGKKICLLNKNSYEYAVNTFGIILAGGVLVLLNQHKSWDELSYELGLVEPAAILTDGDDYGTKEQLQAAYGSILRPMDGFRAYEPVAEMPRCIGHDDLMILMFTSGTTGRSKGVMLSERNFFSVMRAHVQIGEHMMEYKHDPELVVSQYTVLPMFHLGAFICLFSWAHGGWALNISGDIRNFYKEIRRMPSQVMAVVPVIMNSLHKDVMRGRKERLGELWVPICSSAMFDPQVMLDMATSGMLVVQTYGATETCGDGIINYAQDAKRRCGTGQRLSGLQARAGRRAVHPGRQHHAGLLQGPRGHRCGHRQGRLVPHRRPCPGGRGRLLLHYRPQEESDHSGQRREPQPRGAGGHVRKMSCRTGMYRKRTGQKDRCCGIL